jgi:hypothetical protein
MGENSMKFELRMSSNEDSVSDVVTEPMSLSDACFVLDDEDDKEELRYLEVGEVLFDSDGDMWRRVE